MNVTIEQPKRGPGTQKRVQFAVSSYSYTWSWGSRPAEGMLTYVPQVNMPYIVSGAWMALQVPGPVTGLLRPAFFGICMNGPYSDENGQVIPLVRSSGGNLIQLKFVDTRLYLDCDYVYGCFNKLEVRIINGRRTKRYWHILPGNYGLSLKTYTDKPYSAEVIINYLLGAPTVETPWRALYHPDQVTTPIYDLDCMGGRKLADALTEISERMGLVFTINSVAPANPIAWTKLAYSPFTLIWARKGEGIFPQIPANSDNIELGYELSGGATQVHVVGDRNKYLVLNVPLTRDWNPSFESIWDVDLLAEDLFANESGDEGPYNAIPNDVEQIIGRQLAAARAREITVREYAALRQARDGTDFTDYRRFGTRMRMDMPVALYLRYILFRAFRPPGTVTIRGVQVPLASLNLVDELPAGVNYDPETGKMTATVDPDEVTLAAAGGNGFAVVQGYQVGSEVFKAIRPDRFNLDKFTEGKSIWKPLSFQIDDSGDPDGKFILFDEPIISVDGLVKIVDGHAVLSAVPTFTIPRVMACLTFEGDKFMERFGVAGGRDELVAVNGLHGEFIMDGVNDRTPVEIPYADGLTAHEKAVSVASPVLKQQWIFPKGRYQLKLKESDSVPLLTNMLDRVTLEVGQGGRVATVDFTSERPPIVKQLEREYDRRQQLQPLLPGQKELREQANLMRVAAAALRQSPGIARQMGELLHGRLGGRPDLTPIVIDTHDSVSISIGTPLWKAATSFTPNPNNGTQSSGPLQSIPANTRAAMPSASGAGTPHFVGVTVRDEESSDHSIKVQSFGEALVRVMGPVAVEDNVGRADGMDYLKKVTDGKGSVGKVMQAIGTSEVKLVWVQIGIGGGGGTQDFRFVWA